MAAGPPAPAGTRAGPGPRALGERPEAQKFGGTPGEGEGAAAEKAPAAEKEAKAAARSDTAEGDEGDGDSDDEDEDEFEVEKVSKLSPLFARSC